MPISLVIVKIEIFAKKLVSKKLTWVLYMSIDKFLLAVESSDLSQADKSII